MSRSLWQINHDCFQFWENPSNWNQNVTKCSSFHMQTTWWRSGLPVRLLQFACLLRHVLNSLIVKYWSIQMKPMNDLAFSENQLQSEKGLHLRPLKFHIFLCILWRVIGVSSLRPYHGTLVRISPLTQSTGGHLSRKTFVEGLMFMCS